MQCYFLNTVSSSGSWNYVHVWVWFWFFVWVFFGKNVFITFFISYYWQDKIHFKLSSGFSQTPSTVSRFITVSDYNSILLQLLVSAVLLAGFTHKDAHENIFRNLKARKKINLICGIQVFVEETGTYVTSVMFNVCFAWLFSYFNLP